MTDWSDMLAQGAMGAAKGAAMGSVVPGVGTAIGAVGGAALSLAPQLGQWMFGPGSAPTVKAVQTVMESVTGTADPVEQAAAIADPGVAGTLRVQLAAIAAQRQAAADAASQAQLVAVLGDAASARNATAQLAQAHSPMAWGAAVCSLLVLLTFGVVMIMAFMGGEIPNTAVVNVLLGSLTAMATSVVSYWVGSSLGSYRKDTNLIAQAKR